MSTRQFEILTTCRASVRERWVIEVADGFPLGDGIPIEDVWSEVLDSPERFAATIVHVANVDVWDEDDREYESSDRIDPDERVTP